MSRAEHCQSEQGSLCPEPSTGSPLRPKEKSYSLGGGRGSPWPGPRPSPGQTPARSFHPWNTQLFPASGPLHWLVPPARRSLPGRLLSVSDTQGPSDLSGATAPGTQSEAAFSTSLCHMGLVYFLQSAFRFLTHLRDLFIALLALRPHWDAANSHRHLQQHLIKRCGPLVWARGRQPGRHLLWEAFPDQC